MLCLDFTITNSSRPQTVEPSTHHYILLVTFVLTSSALIGSGKPVNRLWYSFSLRVWVVCSFNKMLGDPQGRAHCPDGVYFKWPQLMNVCEQTETYICLLLFYFGCKSICMLNFQWQWQTWIKILKTQNIRSFWLY